MFVGRSASCCCQNGIGLRDRDRVDRQSKRSNPRMVFHDSTLAGDTLLEALRAVRQGRHGRCVQSVMVMMFLFELWQTCFVSYTTAVVVVVVVVVVDM